MTPSTTNTAAREVVPAEMMERLADAAAALDKFGRRDQCRDLMHLHEHLSTLTQQQGGEQEAREFLARECGFDPDSCGKFEGAVVSEAGALRAIATAIRSKQAAGEAVKCFACGAPCVETSREMLGEDMRPEVVKGCRYTPPRHPADEGRDSERLDWLADELRGATLYHHIGVMTDDPAELRKAIDAAMVITRQRDLDWRAKQSLQAGTP